MEVDTRTLLSRIAHLGIKELEEFAPDLNQLIAGKKSSDRQKQEKKLLEQLNEYVLTSEEIKKLQDLSVKIEEHTITEAERNEHLALALREEKLRNERVKIMLQIAEIRGCELVDVMKDLGLNQNVN